MPIDWSKATPVPPATGRIDWSAAKPVEEPPKSGLIRRAIGDTGVSLLKGAVSVPEAAVGLADLPTGGRIGKAAEELGFRPREAKEALSRLYSPEYQEAAQEVSSGFKEGVIPGAKALATHPSVIAQSAAESLPLMGAGGVVARGVRAVTAASPVIAGAVGEGTAGAGIAAESIRQQTETGTLTPEQSALATASGIGTALFGAAGGKIAQKLGIADPDTFLASGLPLTAKRGFVRRVLEGFAAEGAFEELPQSVQERAAENVALGRPIEDGLLESGVMGFAVGGVMGAGFNALAGSAPEQAAPPEIEAAAAAGGAVSKAAKAGYESGAVQQATQEALYRAQALKEKPGGEKSRQPFVNPLTGEEERPAEGRPSAQPFTSPVTGEAEGVSTELTPDAATRRGMDVAGLPAEDIAVEDIQTAPGLETAPVTIEDFVRRMVAQGKPEEVIVEDIKALPLPEVSDATLEQYVAAVMRGQPVERVEIAAPQDNFENPAAERIEVDQIPETEIPSVRPATEQPPSIPGMRVSEASPEEFARAAERSLPVERVEIPPVQAQPTTEAPNAPLQAKTETKTRYADPRLVDETYRTYLKGIRDSAVKRGGVGYVRNERGDIVDRTPSLNSPVVQGMIADRTIGSVKELQNLINKALLGVKPLTEKQATTIRQLLDGLDIENQEASQQTEDAEIDRRYREWEQSREVYEVTPTLMSAEVYTLDQLFQQAREIDEDRAVAAMERGTDAEVVRSLLAIIEEGNAQNDTVQSVQQDQPESRGPGPAPLPAGEGRETRAAGQEVLQPYSEQDLATRQAEQEAADTARQEAERKAAEKEQADRERESFALTGSEREADQAAARGQVDIFSQPVTSNLPVKTEEYFVRIGERRYPVASLQEASEKFAQSRDTLVQMGMGGARETPTPFIEDADGNLIGHVSYNGRVWAGKPHDRKRGQIPIFDPPPAQPATPAEQPAEAQGETGVAEESQALRALRNYFEDEGKKAPVWGVFAPDGTLATWSTSRRKMQNRAAFLTDQGAGQHEARRIKSVADALQTKETEKGVALFSRGEQQSTGLKSGDVRTALAKEFGPRFLERNPWFKVVQSVSELPQGAQAPGTRGVTTHEGNVYLVADHVTADGARDTGLLGVALHEGAHANMASMLGRENWQRVQNWLEAHTRSAQRGTDNEITRAIREARAAIPNDTPERHVAEETLAYMIQQRANHGIPMIRKVLGWLRAWAFRLGLSPKILNTDALVSLARMAMQARTRGVESLTGEPAMASRQAPIFYSELAKQVEAIKTNTAPPAQWKAAIRNLTQKGVKQDEIEWTGVNEWLDMQAAKDYKRIGKEDLLAFLRGNGVRVEETVLGGDAARDDIAAMEEAGEGPDDESGLPSGPDPFDLYDQPTKFGQYQLPGGENYRELLLTLPPAGEKHFQFVIKEGGGRAFRFNGVDYDTEAEARAAEAGARAAEFKSSHFDEPNILAHVRFNERTDADGRRVLFIEEIQSDWAQKGKRSGFASQDESRLNAAKKEYEALAIKNVHGRLTDAEKARLQELRPIISGQGRATGVVPSAPFVTKTEAWVGLALKRMIRYAAENGFDRVAWTTGDQQADRYDLSKQVDSVEYRRLDDGSGIDILIRKDGKILPGGRIVKSEEEAADLLGKEIAEKIRNNEGMKLQPATHVGASIVRELSGLDLKVGGEGMRAFYDRIVPAAAKDVLRKIGVRSHALGSQTKSSEVVRDGGLVDAEAIRDLALSQPFINKGYEGLDGQAKRLVDAHMVALGKNDQILQAIVRAVPVDVVNVLRSQQLTPEMFFHDPSMLVNDATKKLASDMPAFVDVPTALMRAVASVAAEKSTTSIGAPVVVPVKGSAAMSAGIGSHSGILAQVEIPGLGTQPGFDITPAMREKAMGGLPLFNRQQTQQGEFVPAPGGSTDWGRIGADFGREDAPIRLRQGWHDEKTQKGEGLVHIRARHEKQIRQSGYASVEDFVADVLDNYTEVRRGGTGALVLVKQSADPKRVEVSVVRLKPADGGALYVVETALPMLRKVAERLPLLHERSISRSTGTGSQSAFARARELEPVPVTPSAISNNSGAENIGEVSQEINLTLTDTPAFRAWFGNSRMVDKDGEPRTFYHYTDAEFDAFDPGKVGSATQHAASGLGFFFSPDKLKTYGNNKIKAWLKVENPYRMSLEELQGLHTVEAAKARAAELRHDGYDGVVMQSVGAEYVIAFKPTQIKSTDNFGDFDPDDPRFRYSRAGEAGRFGVKQENEVGWIATQDAATQEALRKAGVWRPKESLLQRSKNWMADWQKRAKQGIVDQFDPIKEYDYRAYMLARLTRGSDAALEAVLNYGTVKLDKDGAVDVDFEGKGFFNVLSALNGEHERFMAWVMGNRAARLMEEGREHNFTAEDIARLKALNHGKMKDGSSRAAAFLKAKTELDRYNKSIMDLAEQAGIIDGESRQFWEKENYIPFYRLMEDDSFKGPVRTSGLVRQYAFKTLKGGAQAIGDPLHNMLSNWSHLLDASLKNQAAVASLEAAEKLGAAHKTTAEEKDSVFILKNGQKQYYGIDDPFLLDAVKAIGFTGFQGPAMKAMQNFKRWLTVGVTVNPTFRIRNLIRDSLSMIGANPASYNVLSNVVTGWRGTREGSPEYASIIAGGGVMRFGTVLEGDRARHAKRLIEAGIKDKTVLNTPAKVKDALQQAWDWWQKVGDRAENVNRVALYKKLRAEGKSHLEASYAARDVMDFSMGGTWAAVRFLTQTVPFMNARLQGLYKLGRGAKEDPQRFAAVLGATALASMALLLAYKDDDDWKQREDWDRETYWWFKIGDQAYRIPKPFEIGTLATMAERGLEMLVSDEFNGEDFGQRVWQMLMQQLSLNPMPQMIMPAIEVWANKDSFTGRPIETMGMERLSKSERIGPRTSAVAQVLGKAGVLSPVQIDHVINGYLAWLGVSAIALSDFAVRPAIGAPQRPALRVNDVFVVGDFVKELPEYQSKYVTKFYEDARKSQEAMADVRHYEKLGMLEKAMEIRKDKGKEVANYKLYARAQRQLSEINSDIKKAQMSKGDAEMKRQRLDRLYEMRNRLAELTARRARATVAQ